MHYLYRVEEYRILYRPDPALRGEWTTSIIQAADFRSAAAGNLQGHSYSCLHLRHEGVVFRGSFTFYQLTPASQYEVMVQVGTVQYSTVQYKFMVQARNEVGWSNQVEPFIFTTPRSVICHCH